MKNEKFSIHDIHEFINKHWFTLLYNTLNITIALLGNSAGFQAERINTLEHTV